MGRDKDLGQRKTVDLDRGLFLVQYKGAEDPVSPPKVVVSAVPGHEHRLQVLTHPDSDGETLWQPQTSLVVLAHEPASLDVFVVPTRPNGSLVAGVRIEPVVQGKGHDAEIHSEAVDLGQLRVLGHVAGIGDVVVEAGQWIAGPTAPSRIEGLAIQWPNHPKGFGIKYAVKSGAAGQIGQEMSAGEFAGTRGRALPVTGLTFELTGTLAAHYQISADAIFLASPNMRVAGKKVVMSGPTGYEPLVGLRLAIERLEAIPMRSPAKVERVAEVPPVAPVKPAAATAIAKDPSSGRVRVFRRREKRAAD